MGSSNNGVGSVPSFNFESLSCSHVYKGEIAISVHHEVLRLQIPVNNSISVEVFHHDENLSDQKASVLKSERDDFSDDIEQVLAFDELHDEVDEVAVFEEFVETDDEGVFWGCSQNFLLVHDVLDYL